MSLFLRACLDLVNNISEVSECVSVAFFKKVEHSFNQR